MSDQNENQQATQQASANSNADVDPILTNDLTDTSPDNPLIPKNDYAMTIVKIEQGKSKNSGNAMLNIQLKTINPTTAVNGEALPAGSVTLFHHIVLTPTEKLSAEQIKRALKRFQLACGVQSGPVYPLEQYVGKNVMVSVGISKPTAEYPDERNEVKGFVTK